MCDQIRSPKNSHHHNLMFNHSPDPQRGVILPMTAVSLIMLLSFGALAIDLGYAYVARNEIQNAADTAALNGARYLYPMAGNAPNWTLAQTQATNAIPLNKVTKSSLSTGNVSTGYWDITGSTHGVHSTITGVNDVAAVKVAIDKAANGGPISTFFARIFGVDFMDMSATAVAVVASPGKLQNTNLFPVTISKCMYDLYWNSTTNQPSSVDDLSIEAKFPSISTTVTKYWFAVESAYTNKGNTCNPAGQWTSISTDSNNVPTIRTLIDYSRGTVTPPANYTGNTLGVGDNIWIEPGAKTTLYSSIDSCSDSIDGTGDNTCNYVLIPVVQNVITHAQAPIIGFACLNIIAGTGGATKNVIVRMVAADDPVTNGKCKLSGTGGGAVNLGATLPPKLVNYQGNTY